MHFCCKLKNVVNYVFLACFFLAKKLRSRNFGDKFYVCQHQKGKQPSLQKKIKTTKLTITTKSKSTYRSFVRNWPFLPHGQGKPRWRWPRWKQSAWSPRRWRFLVVVIISTIIKIVTISIVGTNVIIIISHNWGDQHDHPKDDDPLWSSSSSSSSVLPL